MKTSVFPRRFFLPAVFLSVLPGISQAVVYSGDLALTEVMANPAAVSDTAGEWFEVYNRSGAALELNGLVIRDEGSNAFTIAESLVIPADSYFVFGRSADSASNGGYTADYQYSGFTLGNSSDQIILEFDGVIIDSVSYSDGTVFGIAGVSAELTSAGFAATPAGFIYGDGDVGTPGSAGSDVTLDLTAPSAVPLPAAGWLMASALGGLLCRTRLRRD